MTAVDASSLRPICWRDGAVALQDQTLLPLEEVWLELADYRDIVEAIRGMCIREEDEKADRDIGRFGAEPIPFDVTPHDYVTAIITEIEVAGEPYERGLAEPVEASGG